MAKGRALFASVLRVFARLTVLGVTWLTAGTLFPPRIPRSGLGKSDRSTGRQKQLRKRNHSQPWTAPGV